MEHVSISRERLIDLLALNGTELEQGREEYSLEDLSRYRAQLKRHPPRRKLRKQLFLNFKGGTGKTSLSVAYAHRLAELGHRVLLVDLDSQGHATKCLGYEGENCETTLYEVLIKKAAIAEARIQTALTELHLVPANLRMATIDLALMPLSSREQKLRKALALVENEYEYIVMDAPPSFGLLNLNAIVAADDLFVPVLPDFLSFHGLKLLFETLDDVEEDLDHRLDRIFVVVNQYNPTTKIARAAFDALKQHYSEYLLPTAIRQCTKFAQASSEGMPIFAFDATSKGAKDIQTLIDRTDVAVATTAGSTTHEVRI
jgi:chromosome partitioning protein